MTTGVNNAGVNSVPATKTTGVKTPKKAEKPKKNPQAPNIRTTKQGNPYYHSNAGKKTGFGVGVALGLAAGAAVGVFTKSFKLASLSALMSMIKPAAAGIIGGAVLDGVLNHNEKKKADQMKIYNA